jgi:hypothetical protein
MDPTLTTPVEHPHSDVWIIGKDIVDICGLVIHAIDIPALILLAIMAFGLYVIIQAQKRKDFDFADMLRDKVTGRASEISFGILVCIAVSSWIVVYLTINKQMNQYYFLAFLVTWSGSAVLAKWINMKAGLSPLMDDKGDSDDTVSVTRKIETSNATIQTKTSTVKSSDMVQGDVTQIK